jgi:hypothetical protein
VNTAPVTARDIAELAALFESLGKGLPRELRIARHAYIASLRTDEAARRGAIALGRWARKYLTAVEARPNAVPDD